MFRPPASPSSSNFNLSSSMVSDNTSANNSTPAPRLGRKRTYDESRASNSYFDKVSAMEDSARGQARYTLAGQIETPGTQVTTGSAGLDDSLYSDVDYRRRLELSSKGPDDDPSAPVLSLFRTIPLHLAPATPTSPRAAGWTTFAFQAIGGVVGKVWEFCRGGAGAFQGFKAGGGDAYETNGQPSNNNPHQLQISTGTSPASQEQDEPQSPPGAFPMASDVISYVPDSIPDYQDHREEEIYYDFEQEEHEQQQQIYQQQREQQRRDQERQELERQEAERRELQRAGSPDTISDRPAPKRRQTCMVGESDELRRNWVMVDESEEQSPGARRPALALNTRRSSLTPSRIPARTANIASRLQQPNPFVTPTKAAGSMDPPARRFSVTSARFGFEQKSGIPPPRSASRLSMASNASYAGGSVTSPSVGAGDGASFASPRSPASHSTPATPTFAINGSRIPQPRGLGGPNPFANIQRPSPTTNQHQQRVSPSRPTSRHSSRHSVHHAPLTPSFLPRSSTPSRAGHRRSATSLSVGRARSPSGQHHVMVDPQRSPRLDDEAKRLAAQRAAAEKRNTSRLDKLNGELQALIRQGQAALDTEFDVEMGDGDDGWDDYGN
jgi:hypothetical protein